LKIFKSEAAGAGIVDQVHLHVIPGWSGDTHFLSTAGETRMIPESLSDTYQRIRQAWHLAKERPIENTQVPVTGREK